MLQLDKGCGIDIDYLPAFTLTTLGKLEYEINLIIQAYSVHM